MVRNLSWSFDSRACKGHLPTDPVHSRAAAGDRCTARRPLNQHHALFVLQEVDLSAAPPFTLADLKNAIPTHCFQRKPGRSMAYLFRDVAVVLGMAVAAHAINSW